MSQQVNKYTVNGVATLSKEVNSGESPPCMQNIFSSTTAATGKQLKQSVNVFHNLILYRRLHSS